MCSRQKRWSACWWGRVKRYGGQWLFSCNGQHVSLRCWYTRRAVAHAVGGAATRCGGACAATRPGGSAPQGGVYAACRPSCSMRRRIRGSGSGSALAAGRTGNAVGSAAQHWVSTGPLSQNPHTPLSHTTRFSLHAHAVSSRVWVKRVRPRVYSFAQTNSKYKPARARKNRNTPRRPAARRCTYHNLRTGCALLIVTDARRTGPQCSSCSAWP